MSRLGPWRDRRSRDQQIADDISAHLAERIDDLIEAGWSAADARREARREFGNVALSIEDSRQVWSWAWLEHARQDLRYAIRTLIASPIFTIAAAGSLALGLGAATTVFSLLHAALWRPLPLPAPQELAEVWCHSSTGDFAGDCSYSYPLAMQLGQAVRSSGEVIAVGQSAPLDVRLAAGPGQPIIGQAVSANYFSALRVGAAAGRLLAAADDLDGGARVAVLSERLWRGRFGANPQAIGTPVRYQGEPYTIVGVAAAGFSGTDAEAPVDLWVPLASVTAPAMRANAHANWLRLLMRVHPGASVPATAAILEGTFRGFVAQAVVPDLDARWKAVLDAQHVSLRVAPSGFATTGRKYEEPLALIFGAISLVLVIACANVANLTLARNTARRGELAMRRALGASAGRIVRQLLVESCVLTVLGASIGFVLAIVAARAILPFVPELGSRATLDVRPDASVVAFCIITAATATVLFGLGPAMRGRGREGHLLGTGPRVTARSAAGRLLVVVQFATSLVLLVVAGLFLRTLRGMDTADLGFRPDHVVTFDLSLPPGTPPSRTIGDYRAIVAALRTRAGIEAATYAWPSLYGHGGWSTSVDVEGHRPVPGEDMEVGAISVGPHFVEAASVRLLAGRGLEDRDITTNAQVLMVNESFARAFLGGTAAIGRHVTVPGDPPQVYQVVGIVGDVRHYGLREKVWRMIYLPSGSNGGFLVRSATTVAAVASVIRSAVSDVDPAASVEHIRSLGAVVDASAARERLTAIASTVLAIYAVVVASVGLYGLVAYGVAQRRRELAIRVVLGATRRSIQWLVLRRTLALVFVGIGAGAGMAMLLLRWLGSLIEGLLYGVSMTDVAVLAVPGVVLAIVASVVGLAPARQAAHTDPMTACRAE
jgi:predicted permease